jgi:DNA end-binding protein Ku
MAIRANWTGHLKLSLVSIPIRLYNAISYANKVSFNQLHKGCNQRLRQQLVCPQHGKVEREDIAKGYEYEKDRYVVIDEADLEKVELETTKTVELIQFVDAAQIDPIYFDSSHYVAPDGPVAEEAFRIFREALKKLNKVAIGRVVMHGKENIVALRPKDKGFLLTMMHYASEVRAAEPYFAEIKDAQVSKEQLALAIQLIESTAGDFDPAQFNDRYQDSLMEVIKAKIQGSAPVVVQQQQVGKVINLMDALQASIAQVKSQKSAKKPAAASVKSAPPAQKKAKAV